ncbi:FAD-binding oxidoreductase [Candidatus Saccharibacteria bacterium]|nr:FAD-binding oxidoreductase [Candidatus Saccharibacteria bacterium]
MDKVSRYLAEHIAGEVVNDSKVREVYSRDASILQIHPSAIIYPRTIDDLQKILRFSYRLADKGINVPITARGGGTDQTGAAIGEGLLLVFPAHMSKLFELDVKDAKVRVEAGMNFRALQEILYTHGLHLPIFPTSYKLATIGGSIANNASGERSIKYGYMRDFVDRLEVILSNGEIIETGRLSKHDLNKKKGLPGLEGEIYRQLDGLISDNKELILGLSKDRISTNIGYALDKVRHQDGSFDLTPLFVGSQGTLGVISQAVLRAEPKAPVSTLMAVAVPTRHLQPLLNKLFELKPSMIDLVDKSVFSLAEKITGRNTYKVLSNKIPDATLLIEFDDRDAKRKKMVKKAEKIFAEHGAKFISAEEQDDKEEILSLRHITSAIAQANFGGKVALPLLEDAIIPIENIASIIKATKALAKSKHIEVAIWGHIGSGHLTVMPFIDLARLEGRQSVVGLMESYYDKVQELGGVISGARADGRIRAPFAEKQVGKEIHELFSKVKEIFDPRGILNPEVKLGTDVRELIKRLRVEYNLTHFSDHQPRG